MTGTTAWACLILFGAPDDGADTVRQFVVIVGAAIALVTMALYLCTACTDPGIVFRHLAPPATQSLQHRHNGDAAVGEVRRGRRGGVELRHAVLQRGLAFLNERPSAVADPFSVSMCSLQ